jgi:hypothetical protein
VLCRSACRMQGPRVSVLNCGAVASAAESRLRAATRSAASNGCPLAPKVLRNLWAILRPDSVRRSISSRSTRPSILHRRVSAAGFAVDRPTPSPPRPQCFASFRAALPRSGIAGQVFEWLRMARVTGFEILTSGSESRRLHPVAAGRSSLESGLSTGSVLHEIRGKFDPLCGR